MILEEIKKLPEYVNYMAAKQDYADVAKGGKDHWNCSIMDIISRSDRVEQREKLLIETIGKLFLKELEKHE